MVSRIKQLLEWQHLSPTQFADRIGVGRPVVSHILSERNKPSLEVVQRIIAAFPDLSLPWLLSGTGTMLADAAPVTTPPATPVAPAPAPLAASAVVPTTVAQPDAAALPVPAAAPAQPAQPVMVSPPAFRPTRDDSPAPAPPTTVAQPPRFRPSRLTEMMPGALAAGALSLAEPGPVVAVSDPADKASAAASGPVAPVPVRPASERLEKEAVTEPADPLPTASSAAAPYLIMPTQPGPLAAGAALTGLGEPGKAIRRIVIFYRDGSFADYQPEG